MQTKYSAYTDGACSNNQATGGQPGGWGVAFVDGRMLSGGDLTTTNNRMELTAALKALESVEKGSSIDLYSDSAYLINAFSQNWIAKWLKNGWKTSTGKSVENQDLWQQLIPLVRERTVNWIKVKGHSGNKWNDIADKLAVEAIPKKNNSPTKIEPESIGEEQVSLLISRSHYLLLMKELRILTDNSPMIELLYNELDKQGK